jgi:hypothetical protein
MDLIKGKMMNKSILIPNKQKLYILKYAKNIKNKNDEILIFNVGSHQITEIMNKMIKKAKNDYIILIDPKSKNINVTDVFKKAPKEYYNKKIGIIGFKKEKFKPIDIEHKSHISYQKNIIKNINPELICNDNKNEYNWSKLSIIIPFMYNGDRFNLFESCIKNLYNLIKYDKDIELVIHETGKKRYLTDKWIKKYKINYEYTKWDHIFHRAWSLNYAAKNIATGDMYVFMDADLIVDRLWLNEIKNNKTIAIGWSEMINLNEKGTKKFINNIGSPINNDDIERKRYPTIYAAAGGINIYPKKIFFEIKGWCEDYYGTYGGEDNSTFLKIKSFNYNINVINSKVYHLYHHHTTYKDPKRFEIFQKHKTFKRYDWEKYLKNINIWGENKKVKTKLKTKTNQIKILWCKIDTSQRVANHYDDILNALNKECHIDIITQSLQGEHPAIFQQKCLNHTIKRDTLVSNHLIDNKYDFIICANLFAFNNEDWSKIDIPKAALLEDQHGDNNHQLVKDIIKDKWIVLHRYKLKKFHTDLSNYVKCIWFPHSVDIKKFRDFKQRKRYDILQTGALYKVYETRHFIKDTFMKDKRYKIIPRPKENDKKAWPIGKEYSKELNKAYLNVCCGSIYEYPVMKYFEIPASGSAIFGDWFEELGDLGFKPYKNMIEIDKKNVKKQVDLLLKNKKQLLEITKNGYDLIHERHTTNQRAKDLINIIKKEIN